MAKSETTARRVNFTDRPRNAAELRQAAQAFAIDCKAVSAIASRRPLSEIEQQVVVRAQQRAADFLLDLRDIAEQDEL